MIDDFSPEDAYNECLSIAEGFCEATEGNNFLTAKMLYEILDANEWINIIDGDRYRKAMLKYNRHFRKDECY